MKRLILLIHLFVSTLSVLAQPVTSVEEFLQGFDSIKTFLPPSKLSTIINTLEEETLLENSANRIKFLEKSLDYYYYSGNHFQAIKIGKKLINPSLLSTEKYKLKLAATHYKIGRAYSSILEHTMSIEHNMAALRLYNELNKTEDIIYTKSNIAVSYIGLGKYQEAINQYKLILKQNDSFGVLDPNAYINLARAYKKNNQLQLALDYLDSAVMIAKETKNVEEEAYAYRSYSSIYLEEKKYKQAKEYAIKSIKRNQDIQSMDEVLEATSMLCEILNNSEQYSEAIKIGLRHLEIAAKHSNYDQIVNFLNRISDSYKALNEYQKLVELQVKYEYASDSLESQSIANTVLAVKFRTQAEDEYTILKQQEEINTQTIRAQNIMLISAVIGIILLIAIATIIYRALVINKKLSAINKKQSERLKQLDEAKSRFFANISHDLRTPISLMMGSMEQVLKNKDIYLDGKGERQLKTGLQNGHRIIHLTNEINELIKLEEGKLKITKEYINIHELLSLFVPMFSSIADTGGIDLSYSKANFAETPIVHVDTRQFERVMFNLISNALKYTKQNDTITVSLNKEGQKLIISVADTGEGIPEKNVPYIFERYYQAPQGAFKTQEGFGIGLAFIKEIIDQHDANISVSSKQGEGTKFEIKLSLETAYSDIAVKEPSLEFTSETKNLFEGIQDTESSDRPVVRLETKNPEGAVNEKTILIVDDHPEVRQFIQDIVSPYYSIVTASNGEKAIQALETKGADLIITDLMMPWFDGFELIEKLKSNPRFSKIPVLVITARTAEEDKVKIISQGVSDYLHKPFSSDELLARLKNLLDQKSKWENDSSNSIIINNKETLDDIEKSLLKKVDQLIMDRIDDSNLTVADLAKEIAVSERKFFRMIKKLTGTTPFEYIKEIRMQYVHKLITEKKIVNSSEAAKHIGMSNVSHFNEQFKKRFGKKPMEA